MSQDYEMLREVWRKALHAPVRIPVQSVQQARRLRFTLYNAVKGLREPTALVDQALLEALKECSVGFDPEDSKVVVVQKKALSALAKLVEGVLGLEGKTLPSMEELASQEAMERMNKQLGISGPASTQEVAQALDPAQPLPGRSTPYYTRGS